MVMKHFCRILRQVVAFLFLTLIFANCSGEVAQAHSDDAYDISEFNDHAVDIDPANGSVVVTLSKSEMARLASVRCNLLYLGAEDHVVIYLGNDTNIDADWETGVFRDNFGGTWPMLDGHPVYIEVVEEGDNYNIYSIPVKINDEECFLRVLYGYDTQEYSILGAYSAQEESDVADPRLIPVKEGDTITTIHYAAVPSESGDNGVAIVEAETFQVGSDLQVADEKLGDGTYGYMFEFVSLTGESALSEVTAFSIDGDNIVTLET